jgi:hypothetical protein
MGWPHDPVYGTFSCMLFYHQLYGDPLACLYSFNQKSLKMKTGWNGELLQGLQELPMETSASIIAGESLWYWIGYGAGLAVYMITHPTPYQSSGQKSMNAAFG